MDKRGHLATSLPPLPVHVVIECPLGWQRLAVLLWKDLKLLKNITPTQIFKDRFYSLKVSPCGFFSLDLQNSTLIRANFLVNPNPRRGWRICLGFACLFFTKFQSNLRCPKNIFDPFEQYINQIKAETKFTFGILKYIFIFLYKFFSHKLIFLKILAWFLQ